MDVQKLPKAHLSHFSDTMRLTGDQNDFQKNFRNCFFFQFVPHAGTVEEYTWHFEVLLLFLSLRYGAHLGRSRLVPTSNNWCSISSRHIVVTVYSKYRSATGSLVICALRAIWVEQFWNWNASNLGYETVHFCFKISKVLVIANDNCQKLPLMTAFGNKSTLRDNSAPRPGNLPI